MISLKFNDRFFVAECVYFESVSNEST